MNYDIESYFDKMSNRIKFLKNKEVMENGGCGLTDDEEIELLSLIECFNIENTSNE